MVNKKVQIQGLVKLGNFLNFRPPPAISASDMTEFKNTFEPQLIRLLEDDELATNQSLLSSELSSREYFVRLCTPDSQSLMLDDLCKAMLSIWLFLKSENYVSYDPDDFIAKLLELINLIRRKDKATTFGSGSKSDPDKILKPSFDISEQIQKLLSHIGSTELSESIKLRLIDADKAFNTYKDSVARVGLYLKRDDAKFTSIYRNLSGTFVEKGFATQLINCLIDDIQKMGFKVGSKYADKSWTRKINQKRNYIKKARR